MKRVFISDCEGPISKNDNAYEVTSHFIPNGNKLFTVISSYDDVTADILKRPGYKPGNTLKLILPFFKAYGVTDQKIRDFSSENLLLISNTEETLQHVRNIAHMYIVSTSYEHYIRALCQALHFPYGNTYCTKLDIDKYEITPEEKTRMRRVAKEVAKMPVLEIPPNAKSLKDFSDRDRQTVRRLDEIFWEEITNSELGVMYSEVDPVGGSEKAEAIEDVARKLVISIADIMYVGDSITDEQAFRLVKQNEGISVSFNGNGYAIKTAEIAILSETSLVTAVIADVFCRSGKQEVLTLVDNWNHETLRKSKVDKALLNRFLESFSRSLPEVKIITAKNMEALARESSDFRKKVRGEAVGKLG